MSHYGEGKISKTYKRKGSAASHLTFDEVRPHLRDADVLHVTGITPALSTITHQTIFDSLDYARDDNIAVVFDGNYREAIWSPQEAHAVFDKIVPYSTIFKVGHDEAETVWEYGWSAERYARHFQAMNGGLVIVTLGAEGALAFDGETIVQQPGYDIEVLDPVGAGDAFIAGFLGLVLQERGLDELLSLDSDERSVVLRDCMKIANVCGAVVCLARGDVEPMPTMAEVQAFLKQREAA
jgi:2-dehydro-3-deoxygluconokinase